MKKTILIATLAASVACSSGPTEDVDSTSQAITLPPQPFPGFILPGVVGTTAFGTPTPVGISTISGLGAGTQVNLFNLLNTSGVYHNDFGWKIGTTLSGAKSICNLAAPTICLSTTPGPSSLLVLTTSTDPSAIGFQFVGNAIGANGQCWHAASLGSGAAVSWTSNASLCTDFLGIGFNVALYDVAVSQGGGINKITSTSGLPTNGQAIVMDSGFFGVNEWVTTQLPVFGPDGTIGMVTDSVSTGLQPTACPGSTTTTTASMHFVAGGGITGPCSGLWPNMGAQSPIYQTF